MESTMLLVQSVTQSAQSILGVNPIYMLPVFALVAIISKAFNVRGRFDKATNLILGVLAFAVGVLVVILFDDYPLWKMYVRNGFILGATSALTYQIFKPIFKALVNKLFLVVNDRTDSEIKQEDLLV